MAIEQPSSEQPLTVIQESSTTDLVKEAIDEAKELVRIEVELAKTEVKREAREALRAAIGGVIAAVFFLITLCLLAVAIVNAFAATAISALLVAACFLVLSGITAGIAYLFLPKKPLEQTRHRLESDVNQLKERFA